MCARCWCQGFDLRPARDVKGLTHDQTQSLSIRIRSHGWLTNDCHCCQGFEPRPATCAKHACVHHMITDGLHIVIRLLQVLCTCIVIDQLRFPACCKQGFDPRGVKLGDIWLVVIRWAGAVLHRCCRRLRASTGYAGNLKLSFGGHTIIDVVSLGLLCPNRSRDRHWMQLRQIQPSGIPSFLELPK